jgi:hypothetical protein
MAGACCMYCVRNGLWGPSASRGLCVDAAHADPPRPVQELQLQGGARRPRS